MVTKRFYPLGKYQFSFLLTILHNSPLQIYKGDIMTKAEIIDKTWLRYQDHYIGIDDVLAKP